jgi:hypothetical protein
MPDVKGLIADPDFQKLPPVQQRQALQGVTGDQSFASLSDADTTHFITSLGSPPASAPAGGAGGSFDTPSSAPWRFVSGIPDAIKNATLGAGKAVYHAVADAPQNDTEQTTLSAATAIGEPLVGHTFASLAGRATLAGKRLLVDPSVNTYQRGQQYEDAAKDPSVTPAQRYRLTDAGGALKMASYVPVVGPAAGSLALRAAGDPLDYGTGSEPDVAGALGEGLTYAALPGTVKASLASAAKFVAPALQDSAVAQYSKALAPTTKPWKYATKQVVPELLDRGQIMTSPAALAEKAAAQAEPIGEQIGEKIDSLPPFPKPVPKWRPVRGLLQAAPTEIPLAESAPGKMPGALQPAGTPPIPESAFSPEARMAAGDSGIPAIRLTDATEPSAPWRYSTTGSRAGTPELPSAPQSEQGVMVTRDPAIANRFSPQAEVLPPSGPALPKQAQAVIDHLEDYKNGFKVAGVPVDDAAIGHAGELQDIVRQLGPDVSPQSLNRLRQLWDSRVAKAGGYYGKTLNEGSLIDAQKEGANAIRNVLADENPDLAKLNAEYTFWKRVRGVAGATAERQTGQQGGIVKALAPAAGAAAGFAASGPSGALSLGAAFKYGQEIASSPIIRTMSAVAKSKLAHAMMADDVPGMAAAVTQGAATEGAASKAKWRFAANAPGASQ